MKFLGILALVSLAITVEVTSDTDEGYSGEEVEFVVEEEETLGLASPNQVVGYVPGKYSIEFETGSDDGNTLWDDLELEGYNITIGERFYTENSTVIDLEVSNFDNNPNANVSVLNLLEDAEGVIGVTKEQIISAGFSFVDSLNPKWNPHIATGVKRLHDIGIKGKGIKVGIIDSGIDLSHEVFAGRTIKGFDYLGAKRTEVISDVHGHGTFVASVFGGLSSKFVGVAPEADIRMYRVLNSKNQGLFEKVVEAAEQALADKVHLISISIGTPMSSYKKNSLGQRLQAIAKKIPVVVSSGNDGFSGAFQAQIFGAQSSVITVGSTETTSLVMWPMTIRTNTGESLLFSYVSAGNVFPDSGTFTAEYVSDLCSYPGGSPGNIVLIGHEFCSATGLSTKFPNVKAFLSFSDTLEYKDASKFGLTERRVEKWILDRMSSSTTFTVTMDSTSKPVMSSREDSWAGKISQYSTWGPTFTSDFYPSILAPGGSMFGASHLGGYRISSGTSYSTPYVAGVIALYLSQNPGASAEQVRKRLFSTATLMPLYKDGKLNTKYKEPVIHQGAGLVNAWHFLKSEIELTSEPLLSWGDRDQRPSDGAGILKWKNTGRNTRTYRVTHGKGMAVVTRTSSGSPARYYPNLESKFAKSTLFNSPITLRPGQEALFKFWLTAPAALDSKKSTAWQGYYRITDDRDLSITIPYMGIEGKAFDWNPIHAAPEYSPLFLTTEFSNKKWPSVSYTLDYGTYIYSFDLVREDFDVSGYKGSWTGLKSKGYIDTLKGSMTFKGVKENVVFPEYQTKFGNFKVDFTGLGSGAKVQPGRYRILMRALRINGDAKKLSHWQLFLSDTVLVDNSPLIFVPLSSSKSTTKGTTSLESSSSDNSIWESSSSMEKWSNSSSSFTDEYVTPVTPTPLTPTPVTPSPEVPAVKSSTLIEEVTVTKSCTTGCEKSNDKPKDKVTMTKSCTTGCNEPNDKVTVTKSCTTGCNEPKDKIVVTTITKCSYGGCENIPVTIGETKTVKMTVTSCSNNVCATKVTLVAEYIGATSVGGKVEIYTSASTIENTHSVSTFHNAASRAMGLFIILLLSFLAI